MQKLFAMIVSLFTAGHSSSLSFTHETLPSFISSAATFFSGAIYFISNIFSWIFEQLKALLWIIIRFALGILELFEYVIRSLLGIGYTVNDAYNFAKDSMVGGQSILNYFIQVFRAIVGVAIVLILIFAIIAIIKNEYNYAANKGKSNDKSGILRGILTKFLSIAILPILLVLIYTGLNSILTSFDRALKGDTQNATLATQVLNTAVYDGNKYRTYAKNNKRLPIIIEAYDVTKYKADETKLLASEISSRRVQEKLVNAYGDIATGSGISFAESVKYENNKIINSSKYADYYENFVCTSEQYQLMAEFIDYVQKENVNFYIKSTEDPDVEWKYVESTVYNQTSKILTISYSDYDDVNKNGDVYTVVYTPAVEVTSPISNALNTISALLGVNEFGENGDNNTNEYLTMERESDSVNVVNWTNEKVLLQFSDDFEVSNPSTWTSADEILLYEYYHFSSNNTLAAYSLNDLLPSGKGALLDARRISYRDFYSDADTYLEEKNIDVAYINGVYYPIEKSKTKTDAYGNSYYILKTIQDVNFLTNEVIKVNKVSGAKAFLKLSDGFDINDPSSWNYADQIIVYEYYSDLSYRNTLSRYTFDKFFDGIEFDVYQIAKGNIEGETTSTKDYVYINGTYYAVNKSGRNYILPNSNERFINEASSNGYLSYNYIVATGDERDNDGNYINKQAIKIVNNKKVSEIAILNIGDYKLIDDVILELEDQLIYATGNEKTEIENKIAKFNEYSSYFEYKFSTNFNYQNTDTWTYRDYFLFYTYLNYLRDPGTIIDINTLKIIGLSAYGDLVVEKYNGKYGDVFFKLNRGEESPVFYNLDEILKISELTFPRKVDTEATIEALSIYKNLDLFVVPTEGNWLVSAATESFEFAYSENYDENDISSWKLVDLILNILVDNNVITNVQLLKSLGYSSIRYAVSEEVEVDGTTKEINYHVYKFGNIDNVVYLSDKIIYENSNNLSNFEMFLNNNALEFVLSKCGTTVDKLILDYDDVIRLVYDNYADSTMSYGELMNMIIHDNKDKLEIYRQITSYNYTNSNFKFDELDTWNLFDLLIYSLTGSSEGEYNVPVVSVGNEKYAIIGSTGVNISNNSSIFKATLKEEGILSSTKIDLGLVDSDSTTVDGYFGSVIGPAIYTDETIQKTVIQESNVTYKYSSNGRSLTSSSVVSDESDTFLDIICAKFNLNDSFEFGVFEDENGVNYLQFTSDGTNYYVPEYIGVNIIFTYKNNSSLVLNDTTSRFIYDSTYTAYDENKINTINAGVYKHTGLKDKHGFKVYKINETQAFIAAGNKILNYNNDTTLSRDYNTISVEAKKELVKNLYDQVYASFVYTEVDGLNTVNLYADVEYDIKFNISDTTTWSPLGIILYSNGIKKENYTDGQLLSVIKSSTSGKNYFVVTNTESNKTYFIDYSSIINANITIDTQKLEEFENANYWTLLEIEMLERGNSLDGFDELVDNEILDINNLNSSKMLISEFDQTLNNIKGGYVNNFNVDDIDSWNLFNLYYYTQTGEIFDSSNFMLFTDSGASNKYISFEGAEGLVYLNFKPELLNFTNSTSYETISFLPENNNGSASTFSPLSIVYYISTGKTSGELYKYTLGDSKEFYCFTDRNNLNVSVYNLTSTEGVGFELKTDKEFLYESPTSINSIGQMTLFDFIVSYLFNTDYSYTFRAYKCVINGHQFLRVNTGTEYKYLDLDFLTNKYLISLQDSADVENLINISNNSDSSSAEYIGAFFGITTDESEMLSINESRGFFKNFEESDSYLKLSEIETKYDELSSYRDFVFEFSRNFDASDPTTWTVSDLVICYLYENGYIENNKELQELVNENRIVLKECYLTYSESDGNILNIIRAIQLFKVNENEEREPVSDLFIDFEKLDNLKNTILVDIKYSLTEIQASYEFTYENDSSNVNVQEEQTDTELNVLIPIKITAFDLIYKNYYYFNVDEAKFMSDDFGLRYNKSDTLLIDENQIGSINLKLSDDFSLTDVSTWTILDYIVLYEFSQPGIDNMFSGMTFDDLKTKNNYYYVNGNDETKVLIINGRAYDLTNYLTGNSEEYVCEQKINGVAGVGSIITYNARTGIKTYYENINNNLHSFRTVGSVTNYSIANNEMNSLYVTKLSSGANSLVYSDFDINENGDVVIDDEITVYRYVDTNLSQNYQYSLRRWDNPVVTKIVLKVNWVQKLMNDMQVIYPDLNWSTLIATDGWLDTLGKYSSGTSGGSYISNNNSANITAAGLVLSEFLLANADSKNAQYSNYNYSPIFDEKTINALMLAMCGEEDYVDIKQQVEVFSNMFNVMFGPVLDDIAYEFGIDVKDGKVNDLTMSTYKSYLATQMLGSDMAEYLYTIAIRTFAEYTLYEELAKASGDYARFNAYINGQKDENGNEVNFFTYGSFQELTIYENTYVGGGAKPFTFHFNKVFDAYKRKYSSSLSAADALQSESEFRRVMNFLDQEYKNRYESGKFEESDDLYCYMLDVYYSANAKATITAWFEPDYLEIYHNYILGNIPRWFNAKDSAVEGGSDEISRASDYTKLRISSIIKATLGMFDLITPKIDMEINGDTPAENIVTAVLKYYKNIADTATGINTTLAAVENSVTKDSSNFYRQKVNNVLSLSTMKTMFSDLYKVADGDISAWNKVLKLAGDARDLADAFSMVTTIPAGEERDGITHIALLSDTQYQQFISTLNNFAKALNDFVEAQLKLDVVTKTSISYVVKQYAQDYVPSGYKFNIENREYSIKPTVSNGRIAEYVMGGSFLARYNIKPLFTDDTYDGFIELSNVYDSETNSVRTKIDVWKLLRKFASKLADYTAKLYYMTNLKDLSANVNDSVLMTDFVEMSVKDLSSETNYQYQLNTSEYAVLEYLLTSKDIDIEGQIFANLIFKDKLSDLEKLDNCPDNVKNLADKLEKNESFGDSDSIKMALVEYLRFIESNDYKKVDINNSENIVSGYYYADSVALRIHEVFKNVMTYLLVNEEDVYGDNAQAIDFDNWTMKDFRIQMLKGIIAYKQNQSETSQENAARYLALFNLLSCQIDYSINGGSGLQRIGTVIGSQYYACQDRNTAENIDGENRQNLAGDVEGYYYVDAVKTSGNKREIYANFSISATTKQKIVELAGIPNRPLEELVNLEYDHLYDRGGVYDEAMGDTFVLCFYDDNGGKYIPFLTTNYESVNSTKLDAYLNDFGMRLHSLYAGVGGAYPIIAKGVITTSGKPTAIRVEDGNVIFYRTDIGISSSIGDDAVKAATVMSHDVANGFTDFSSNPTVVTVSPGRQPRFIDSIIGGIKGNSSAKGYLIQRLTAYSVKVQETGAYSVLDDIAGYYNFNSLTYMLLAMSLFTLFPLLFYGILNAMRRIFDLMFYILAGPWVFALSFLQGGGEKDGKAYNTWRGKLTQTLLTAFGYVIGFNVYYILVSTIANMTFVSDVTISKIHAIANLPGWTKTAGSVVLRGLFDFGTIETILKVVFFAVAAAMVKGSADLLGGIITGQDTSNAFSDNVFQSVKSVANKAKNMVGVAGKLYSGQALVDMGKNLKNFAIEGAMNLPGAGIVRNSVEKGKRVADGFKARHMSKQLEANGIGKNEARAAGQMYRDQMQNQRETIRKNRIDSANKAAAKFGLGDKLFSSSAPEVKPHHPKNKKDKKSKDKKPKKDKK